MTRLEWFCVIIIAAAIGVWLFGLCIFRAKGDHFSSLPPILAGEVINEDAKKTKALENQEEAERFRAIRAERQARQKAEEKAFGRFWADVERGKILPPPVPADK